MPREIDGVVYLTCKEAAAELGIKQSSISIMVRHGKLQGFELGYGREKFVRKADIDAKKILTPMKAS